MPVTRWATALLLILLVCPDGRQAAGAETVEVGKELRRLAHASMSVDERTAALERLLASPKGGEPELWAYFAWAFDAGPQRDLAGRLMRRALHEGLARIDPDPLRPDNSWRPEEHDHAVGRWQRMVADAIEKGSRELAARAAAFHYVKLGGPLTAAMLAPWPPSPLIRAIVEEDLGRVTDAKGESIVARWDEDEVKALAERLSRPLEALNQAGFLGHASGTKGLESLRNLGTAAVPLLLHEARRAAEGIPEGRIDRCVNAITVLGLIGDRSATEPLMACLLSGDGWIRAAAATALGDLSDPKAAIALARQLAYAGDPFRSRESWDYPGTTETTVKPEDWNSVEYYVIDAAAADALLAMGSPGAVGWLLKNDLDPKRRNLRIRVLQDALDTIHRHLPDAPTTAYDPDAGLPQRHAAFEKLEAWWRANRQHPYLLKKKFDEQDPGWLESARGLARRLGEPKVLELMIAKDSCEILGHVITPVLIEALGTTKSATHKNELAQALARVRDRRAVPALLLLLGEKIGFVRAAALSALGAYARDGAPSVLAALVAGLDDPDCGAQVAAMQALVAALPTEIVREAIAKHDEAAHTARCGADANYAMALTVVRLVQEGDAHWPRVRDGLRSKDRVERRSWWDLLRLALDLYEHLYDPIADPASPDWRPIDDAHVLKALRARRGDR